MLAYYLVYRDDTRAKPAGIFVLDTATDAAILWNHRLGEWTYDPDLVLRFLDDHQNLDRFENVDRSTVEGLVKDVTGGKDLPGEDLIRSMLREGMS